MKVLKSLNESGLKGKGGAGFPTGKKWEIVSGYKGNKHKSFSDIDEAIEFFESYNRELFDE